MKKPTTYTINYGLSEGPQLGRRLRKYMRRRDFHFRSDSQASDVIIAHSAGCWFLPEQSKAQIVCLVGMPLPQVNLHRTFWEVNRSNMWQHFRALNLRRFLQHSAMNTYYILKQLRRTKAIIRMAQNMPDPKTSTAAQCIFIVNRHDAWHKSPALAKYIERYDWAFISLPGSHNDIWDHSERYAAIIDHYARLLAKADTR